MPAKARRSAANYGIGAVAKLTGLTDHTIRVWERRYGAVVARRAANGRRFYTAADVEKLSLLKRLTDRGLAIGQIARSDIEELEQRLDSLDRLASAAVPERVAIAILGDFLPARLRAEQTELAPLELVVAGGNVERFMADLDHYAVDVVVVESATLETNAINRLRDCLSRAGIERGILVYSFARSADVEKLRGSGIVAIRAPITGDELRSAVIRAYAPRSEKRRPAATSELEAAPWSFSQPVAPRRFDQQQLARLANVTTAIDCECPRHLAQLIYDLSAFEVYSASCSNRDDEDAALHRYLHRSTAEARALIEAALLRVIEVEGIDY